MKIKILILIIILGIGGFLTYRYTSNDFSKKGELQDVNLKLKWLHQAQFAGNYVAKEKGFYEREGINLHIIPFSFENPTIYSVAAGEDTFGITGADELVLARAEGMPIKAFAVIYKINPVVAFSLKGSGITKPQDFVGKTVGIPRPSGGADSNVGILYFAMMSKLGIDRSKVKEVTIGYTADELLEGKIDVSTGYIINEPQQVVEKLGEVNTILMADYGVNMYADVLFATEDTLKNKPELVDRFLAATIDGWRYAIEYENEAVDITLKYAKNSTKEHEAYMLALSLPLIHVGNTKLGVMEARHWEQIQSILESQNILKKAININDAYTNDFIDRYYQNEAKNR